MLSLFQNPHLQASNNYSHLYCPLAILLGSVKAPYEEIKRRIVEMDEDQLTVAMVEQLIKYMPEPEQMSQLAELKSQYNELAESEQFGVVVSYKCSSYTSLKRCQYICLVIHVYTILGFLQFRLYPSKH